MEINKNMPESVTENASPFNSNGIMEIGFSPRDPFADMPPKASNGGTRASEADYITVTRSQKPESWDE